MTSFPLSPANPSNIIPILDRNGRPYDRGSDETGTLLDTPNRDRILSGDPFGLLQWAHAMPGFSHDALISHRGWEVADNMFINSAYQALSSVKENSIIYKPWAVNSRIQSKEKDTEGLYQLAIEAADFCRHLMENIAVADTKQATDPREIIMGMIKAMHYGASMQEINTKWFKGGKYDGLCGISDLAFKQAKNVGYWLHRKTNRILSVNIFNGGKFESQDDVAENGQVADGPWDWDLPLEKFLYYCYRKKDGLPYGWGDFRPAHPHTVVLDLLMKLWVILVEKFAGGFLKGFYSNPADARLLLDAMDKLRRGAAVALPEGLDITLEQLSGNGIESVSTCITYNKLQLAELLLGQSLTTSQGDRGSYAHAHVHQDTQEFFLAYVRRDIEFQWEQQIFRRFLNFNYGDKYDAVIPRLSLGVWNWQEINLIGDAVKKFVDMGAVGAKAPFVRELPGFPAYDKDVEGDLTIEPDRERVTIDKSDPGSTGPSKQRPGTSAARPMKLSDVHPDDRILVISDPDMLDA